MITEDYVSFETAKLLKEKGFDGPCHKVWGTHGDSQTLIRAPWFVEGETVVNRESVDAAAKQYAYEYSLNNNVEGYLAPTIQMVMKWLRDIHGLFIHIDVIREVSCWLADIQDIKGDVSIYPVKKLFPNYEEACENAIKYCLEILI